MTDQHPGFQAHTGKQAILRDDEIDLVELFAKIWGRKWWVVVATVFALAIAGIYIVVAKPVYSATVHLKPPSLLDLQELNQSVIAEGNLTVSPANGMRALDGNSYITSEFVYSAFLTALKSRSNQRQFLSPGYAPVKVGLPKKKDDFRFTNVSLQGGTPSVASDLNQYVISVQAEVVNELVAYRHAELKNRISNLKRRLDMRETFLKEEEGDALLLLSLREQLAIMQSVAMDKANIRPVKIDLEANKPVNPIKPKKQLILAAAIVLGGMLGVFIALVVPARREGLE